MAIDLNVQYCWHQLIITPNCMWAFLHSPKTMGSPGPCPCSMSSYSTLKPEMVSEAETQEMTKLLAVISVTDSEMSTKGGSGVISPWVVATREGTRSTFFLESCVRFKGFSRPQTHYQLFCKTGAIKYKKSKIKESLPRKPNCIQTNNQPKLRSTHMIHKLWWSESVRPLVVQTAAHWSAGLRTLFPVSDQRWCRSSDGLEWSPPSMGLVCLSEVGCEKFSFLAYEWWLSWFGKTLLEGVCTRLTLHCRKDEIMRVTNRKASSWMFTTVIIKCHLVHCDTFNAKLTLFKVPKICISFKNKK